MYLLGIDNGSTMIKAVLFDMQGNQIDAQKEKVELLTPKPGYYERSLTGIWEANVSVIKRVIENSKKILGLDSIVISGIAITGHGNGLHLIDRHGNPLGNAIEGSDNRASQYVKKWYQDGTFEKAHPMIMQNLWAAQLPPLLAWFRDNRPEILEEAAACLMVKDFVRYKLTGEVFVEMSDITGSSIMNVVTGQYDDRLFELYGLKEYKRLFPEIRGGAEQCGAVTQEAAELTGLTAGISVAGGVFDIDGAALGTGVCDESIMNVIVGSWCNNQYITTTPPEDKDIFMVSRYVKDGYWLILEGSPTSASNLEWIVSEFLQDYQGDKYECANNALRNISPQESEVVFVPYLYGSHTGRDSGACFLGVKGYHKREHMLRAVFEGIAFSHRYHIEKLPLGESDTKEIRIAGGAINSDPWMQIFADVLNKPIVVTAGTEIGALGAAICAGVAGGSFESLEDGIANMVHVVQRIEPNPDNIEIYNMRYEKFRKGVSLVNEW